MKAAKRAWIVGIALLGALPRVVAAQDANTVARAKTLFEDGKRLLESKQYDKACSLLSESFQLAAATGPLLALAVCHEREGRTASAWAEYHEVIARTRSEGQADWADRAERAAAALEPKLCKLRVILEVGAESIAGLVVKRDGQILVGSAIGASLPVDPGVHLVEAIAPGRRPWSAEVIAADGAALSVSVPPPPSEPAVGAAAPETPPARMPPLRAIGIASGAAGVIGLGVGTYFALRALAQKAESNADGRCSGNTCSSIGFDDRHDAIHSANIATAAFIAGGVLAAGGVTLIVLGKASGSSPVVTATAIGGVGIAGASLRGSF